MAVGATVADETLSLGEDFLLNMVDQSWARLSAVDEWIKLGFIRYCHQVTNV